MARQTNNLSIMPTSDWPAQDLVVWQRLMVPQDVLDPRPTLANRSKEQRRKFQSAYGRWLAFVSQQQLLDTNISGLHYLHGDQVRAFIGQLGDHVAPISVRGYLTDLLTVARLLAPTESFTDLHAATRYAWRTAKPVRDKRARIVPSSDLYHLGFTLMDSSEKVSKVRRAIDYRDGLIIALLAARPIRLKNLSSITLDRHLSDHDSIFWLSFQGSEVKNGRSLEFPLPKSLTGPMEQYINEIRPYLLARGPSIEVELEQGLWISRSGTRFSRGYIKDRIALRTKAAFGHQISAHMFRDCVATSIAIEDPAHVGIITTILGHNSTTTAELYYNQATTLDSMRHYQEAIAALA